MGLIPTEIVLSILNLNKSVEVMEQEAEVMEGIAASYFSQYSDYQTKNAPLDLVVRNITDQHPAGYQITSRQNLTIDNETAVKIYADQVNSNSSLKLVEYFTMHTIRNLIT